MAEKRAEEVVVVAKKARLMDDSAMRSQVLPTQRILYIYGLGDSCVHKRSISCLNSDRSREAMPNVSSEHSAR